MLDEIKKFRDDHSELNLGIEHEIGLLMYQFILEKNIRTIVETGINFGFSSWYFLKALYQTEGKLYSIEAFPKKEEELIVPKEFWKNWHRFEGACPQKLCSVLKTLKKIDLFWHDSDHSFGCQFGEYTFASQYAKYIGSHDISRSGAWEAFLPLFGWVEILQRIKFGVAKKKI